MYFPLASNSSRVVVAFPYSGPEVAVPGWLSTTTVPFELTATLSTSPKFIRAGSFSGSGTDSNWRIGALLLSTAARCWAAVGTTAASIATASIWIRLTESSSEIDLNPELDQSRRQDGLRILPLRTVARVQREYRPCI